LLARIARPAAKALVADIVDAELVAVRQQCRPRTNTAATAIGADVVGAFPRGEHEPRWRLVGELRAGRQLEKIWHDQKRKRRNGLELGRLLRCV